MLLLNLQNCELNKPLFFIKNLTSSICYYSIGKQTKTSTHFFISISISPHTLQIYPYTDSSTAFSFTLSFFPVYEENSLLLVEKSAGSEGFFPVRAKISEERGKKLRNRN
jgi:hypothetical protein